MRIISRIIYLPVKKCRIFPRLLFYSILLRRVVFPYSVLLLLCLLNWDVKIRTEFESRWYFFAFKCDCWEDMYKWNFIFSIKESCQRAVLVSLSNSSVTAIRSLLLISNH